MALDGDGAIISGCGEGNVLYYTRLCTTVLIMKSIDQAHSNVPGVLSLRPQYPLYVGPCKII